MLTPPIKTMTAASRNDGLLALQASPSPSRACAAFLAACSASELEVRRRLLFEPVRGVRGVLAVSKTRDQLRTMQIITTWHSSNAREAVSS